MSGGRRKAVADSWPWFVMWALIVFGVVMMATGWRDCHVEGGKYVRGLFWMECIK